MWVGIFPFYDGVNDQTRQMKIMCTCGDIHSERGGTYWIIMLKRKTDFGKDASIYVGLNSRSRGKCSIMGSFRACKFGLKTES